MRERRSLEERLWARVNKTDSCWLWTGATKPLGYGVIRSGRRQFVVHRVAYELVVGPIPEGLVLDHLCRVRNCVNPAHLEPVTNHANILRGIGLSAVNAVKTHCKRGHEFSPENTSMRSGPFGPQRICRACRRRAESERRRAARLSAP